MNIYFRQAKNEDLDFLTSLRTRTMNTHLKKVGLPVDKESHRKRIFYRFNDARIVCGEGVPIGLLKSYRDVSGWNIVQVQILPEYQSKGIGAQIVGGVIEKAADDGQSVTLNVLKGNPAKALYKRLGFTTVAESDVDYTMRWASKNTTLIMGSRDA